MQMSKKIPKSICWIGLAFQVCSNKFFLLLFVQSSDFQMKIRQDFIFWLKKSGSLYNLRICYSLNQNI